MKETRKTVDQIGDKISEKVSDWVFEDNKQLQLGGIEKWLLK
jgi:hypothetical protein